MKVEVIKEKCIGCGACAVVSESIFVIEDDGKATAIISEVSEEQANGAKTAAESCPTDAIVVE